MFEVDDEKYLLRQISNNQVVLFLGAGFSREAKNKLGEEFPTAWKLGEKMWKFLSYPGKYDDTPLPQMYQAFLKAGIKKDKKKEFLNSNLLSGEIPDIYLNLTIPYWFKIYTINVDDILTKIFQKKRKGIDELKFPIDQFAERDQSLETTQIIYLNGKLPCDPEDVIFSTQQYAKAQLIDQPLYGQFVYDYATLPTIFLGTEIDEPIFEKYIEAREGRFGKREFRPKSFLITPTISPVKKDILKANYNVYHINGTTKDFLLWIEKISHLLPDRKDILKYTFPNLLDIMEYADITGVSKKSLYDFSKSFKRVPKEINPTKERSGFLLGTSPRWNDIFNELDIPRTITKDITQNIIEKLNNKENNKIEVINLIGSAGSGKSTILKRLGLTISQMGHTVFLSYSDYLPKNHNIIDVLRTIEKRVVLLFDNANYVLNQMNFLLESFKRELKYPPIIVLSIRTNYSNRLDQYINPDFATKTSFKIPDLDDEEINNLISKLDKFNLLGILKGKSNHERFKEFKYRAHRQILIAMKEATKGKSFGEIIFDEFNSISPTEAQVLCSCIALNTQFGFPNSKQDLIGFSKLSHNEALYFLETILSGTIIWVGNKNRIMLRHRIIADYMIKNCISLGMLKEAYIRVLSVLAPELKNIPKPSRKFNLFKALIDHRILYIRFKNRIEHARDVYDSISKYFSDDHHFWLQYGSLEVEGKGGDLKLAENYIEQAESLKPDSYFIQNAKCNLYYRKSNEASNLGEALDYKKKADDLAQKLLLSKGKDDAHIYHIYCRGKYNFLSKWITDRNEKKEGLDSLKSIIKTALSFHPFNERLKVISDAINRAYLQLGLNETLEDPEIPDFIN